MLIQNIIQSSWQAADRPATENAPGIAPVAIAKAAASPRAVVAPANDKPVESSRQPDEMPDDAKLQESLDNVNRLLQQANIDLQFSIDKESQRTVVKLVDSKTGEIIRQYPSEAALAISRSIGRIQNGMLLDQKA